MVREVDVRGIVCFRVRDRDIAAGDEIEDQRLIDPGRLRAGPEAAVEAALRADVHGRMRAGLVDTRDQELNRPLLTGGCSIWSEHREFVLAGRHVAEVAEAER